MNRSRITGDLTASGLLYADIANDRVGIGSTIPGNKLSLPDNAKMGLGNAEDLTLFHDGSNSYITNTTGQIAIKTPDNSVAISLTDANTVFNDVAKFNSSVLVSEDIAHIGDTNTKIRFPAADTVTVETDGDERLRIDSGGRLLVNQTAGLSLYANGLFQVSATDGNAALSVTRWSDNSSSPYINLGKSRSGTVGTYTIVQDGDRLGQINFTGADGTDLASSAAEIAAFVDGTPGGNDMPGRLIFSTTADGATAATERLRITSGGKVGINETSPSEMLHIKDDGNADAYGGLIVKSNNGTASVKYGWRGIDGDDHVRIATGDTERLRITSGGVLCVGATAASGSEFLRVKNELLVMNPSNLGDAFIKIKAGETGGSVLEFQADEGDDNDDYWRIQNAGDGLLGFRTKASGSWVEKLRIQTSGKTSFSYDATPANAQYGQIEISKNGASNADPDWSYLSFHRVGQIAWQQGIDSNAFVIAKTGGGSKDTLDAERLRIDSSGHVMIGTTTEGFATYGDQFTIANSGHCGMTIRSGSSNYGTIYFSDGDDGSADEVRGFVEYNHSDNQLSLGSNGSARLRINSSGRVLIGTTTEGNESADELTVSNSGNTGITIRSTDSSNCSLFFSDATSGASEYAGYVQYMHSNDSLKFGTGTSERLVIDSNGRLTLNNSEGIKLSAVTSSLYALDGSLSFYSTSNGVYLNGAGANGWLRLNASGVTNSRTCIDLYGPSHGNADAITFKTAAAERLRIDSGGKLLLGTTRTQYTNDYYDDITINNSGGSGAAGGTGITMISNSASWGALQFGDQDDDDAAYIKYDHNGNKFIFGIEDGSIRFWQTKAKTWFGTTGHGDGSRSTLFDLVGANEVPTGAWGQMGLYSSDSIAQDKGGSITFGGQDGTTARQYFAGIQGAKENGTSGNYAGNLNFFTRPSGAVPVRRLRIESWGSLTAWEGPSQHNGNPGRLASGHIMTWNSTHVSGGLAVGWYPIIHLTDGCYLFMLKTGAHSSILFTASNGYDPSNVSYINVLHYTNNRNSSYLNVDGLRATSDGVIEVHLTASSSDYFEMQAQVLGAEKINNSLGFYSTLTKNTGSPTVNDTKYPLAYSAGAMQLENVQVDGALNTAGSKNFRIPHPLSSLTGTKDLVHASVEGPRADLIYRDKVDLVGGTATINIDTVAGMTEGTFAVLTKNAQCFTTNETGWTNVKGSISGNALTITAQDNSCTDTISWMVVAQRKDANIISASSTDSNGDLILEPPSPLVDTTGQAPDDSKPNLT